MFKKVSVLVFICALAGCSIQGVGMGALKGIQKKLNTPDQKDWTETEEFGNIDYVEYRNYKEESCTIVHLENKRTIRLNEGHTFIEMYPARLETDKSKFEKHEMIQEQRLCQDTTCVIVRECNPRLFEE